MTDDRSTAIHRAAQPHVCDACGKTFYSAGAHMEECPGQSPADRARIIVRGGAFVDEDAVVVARAYLGLLEGS